MLWQDRAFLAAAGAGTVLSVAHYLATFQSVTGPVPLHFNLFGTPDRFGAAWSYVLYPVVSISFGITAVAITSNPSLAAALPANSMEQVATRASLLCGYAAIVACQVCAARIADGQASKLPTAVLSIVYGGLGASLIAAVAAKYMS